MTAAATSVATKPGSCTTPNRERLLQRQRRNPSPTEIVKLPGHGHPLTIDSGWREIADRALEFIRRFAPADANPDT